MLVMIPVIKKLKKVLALMDVRCLAQPQTLIIGIRMITLTRRLNLRQHRLRYPRRRLQRLLLHQRLWGVLGHGIVERIRIAREQDHIRMRQVCVWVGRISLGVGTRYARIL